MTPISMGGTNSERTLQIVLVAVVAASMFILPVAANAAPGRSASAPAVSKHYVNLSNDGTKASTWRTPSCRATVARILAVASGGCDGYGGPGLDRLVVQCNGYRGTIIYMSGAWMDRWHSWQYNVWCPGGYGYQAVGAWFEHR